MLTRDKLVELIDKHDLSEYKDFILQHSKPAIHLTREFVPNEDDLPIGASKIGGNPDLPADFEWQFYRGQPLTFLAQFKMSDVKPYDVDNVLPESSWLYFFYDTWSPHIIESWNNKGFLVYYVENDETTLQRIPHVTFEEFNFQIRALPAFKLNFSKLITPSVSDEFLQLLSGDTFLWESDLVTKYYGIENDITHKCSPLHYLLGNPFTIQGDPRLEAQKAMNGLDIFKNYSQDVYDKLKIGLSDWRLLFQFDTDSVEEANFYLMFGDTGRLYYMIREQDLKTRIFDKVWGSVQGS